MHSKFPWTRHPHTPTAVFDADGKRIVDQWVAPDDGWEPIETAPRDGTSFLVCVGNWMTVCCWNKHRNDWCTNGPVYSPYGADERPTHWQPLPAPPSDRPAPTPLDPETAADNAALIAAIPGMVEALKAYEQWEADIIMERKCWDGPMPVQLTRDLYNRMIEIQGMRNAVLASIGSVK